MIYRSKRVPSKCEIITSITHLERAVRAAGVVAAPGGDVLADAADEVRHQGVQLLRREELCVQTIHQHQPCVCVCA